MRVCVVTPALPPKVGGAEVSIQNHVLGLVEHGCIVDVVSGNAPLPELARAVEAAGGSVVVADPPPRPERVTWEYDLLKRAEVLHDAVAELRPDVLHAFSHATALSAALALAADAARPAIVASYHEMSAEDTPFGRSRSRFVYELPQVDCVIAASRHYEEVARRHGLGGRRLRRMRQGIDVAGFGAGDPAAGRALAAAAPDELLVVCPSRFVWWKGQLDAIRAFARLRPPARLVLAGSFHSGSPAYLEQLESEAGPVAERVTFLLDTPYRRMPDLLRAADVVVLPSHREGYGLAAIEAMAAGTPVVVTSVGGFDEYCVDGRNCVIVRPEEPAELAAAVERLREDAVLRGRIAEGARATALEHDWRVGAGDAIAAYEAVIAERAGD